MKKIDYYKIFDFLALLAFSYFPDYLLSGRIDTAYDIYSLVIFLTICIFYFVKRKLSMPKIILLVFLMQLIPLIVTATYGDHSLYKHAIRILMGSVSLACFIDYNISVRKKDFLQSVVIFLGTLVVLNILSFFIYYPSMNPEELNFYFLGNDNGSIYETFTFVYLSLIYYELYKNKVPIYFYLILGFIFAGYLYVKSGNGMVCMFITILFVLLYNKNLVKKVISPNLFLAIYLLLFIIIVVVRDNSFLVRTVLKILDKSPTISGRTYIWDKCFHYISVHPILGNGYENAIISMAKLGNSKAHNVIIQYLYTGGVMTLSLFLIIVGMVIHRIKKCSIEKNVKNIMIFSLFLFFVISIFDFYTAKFTTIMMLLIYYFLCQEESVLKKKKTKNVVV